MQPCGLFAVYARLPTFAQHHHPAALPSPAPSLLPFSYGPFNFNGAFTTDSNRKFDAWLKSRNALSGIRDFEAVRDAAAKVGAARL